MDPNEQPDERADRALTIPLTQENLFLAAAVVFLLAAVVLAVFFSMDGSGTPAPNTTAVANIATPAQTAGPLGAAGTALSGGDGQNSYPPSQLETAIPTFVAQPSQPYPGPNEPGLPTAQGQANPNAATTTPDTGFSPAATATNATSGTSIATNGTSAAVPTFEPTRPTTTPGGGSGAYPAPATAAPQSPGQTATQAPTTGAPATSAPRPQATTTPQPAPTDEPQLTSEPAGGADTPPTAEAPRSSATAAPPTPLPVDVIRGSMRWSANQSPIIVRRDLQIAPGSTLVVDPGVEVKLAPGVAIFVDGKMYASGQPDKPVRFSSIDGQRWDAIYGRPGGDIGLQNVEISGGGTGGTLISSEGGNLSIARSRIRDNGGQIRVLDSRLEMRETDMSGNDLPYGAAVEAVYSGGGGATLIGNRIGGNKLAAGAPPVQIRNESTSETVNLDVQGNLMVGGNGPDMVIFANGPVRGGMSCNAWMNGTSGLAIKGNTLQVAPEIALTIANNAIEDQTPPIIPEYLQYGIGRGATSDIYVDMRNNWWRSNLGPYHPDLHADGRGEAVGANITFAPWLNERPACAPRP